MQLINARLQQGAKTVVVDNKNSIQNMIASSSISMDELQWTFFMYLGLCGISCGIFFIEFLIHRFNSLVGFLRTFAVLK